MTYDADSPRYAHSLICADGCYLKLYYFSVEFSPFPIFEMFCYRRIFDSVLSSIDIHLRSRSTVAGHSRQIGERRKRDNMYDSGPMYGTVVRTQYTQKPSLDQRQIRFHRLHDLDFHTLRGCLFGAPDRPFMAISMYAGLSQPNCEWGDNLRG